MTSVISSNNKIKCEWIQSEIKNGAGLDVRIFGKKDGSIWIQNQTNGLVRMLLFTKDRKYAVLNMFNLNRTDINTFVVRDNFPDDPDYMKKDRFEIVYYSSYMKTSFFHKAWLYAGGMIFIKITYPFLHSIRIDEQGNSFDDYMSDLNFPYKLD